MKRVVAQVKKELTQLSRDKLTLALALALPVLLLLLRARAGLAGFTLAIAQQRNVAHCEGHSSRCARFG